MDGQAQSDQSLYAHIAAARTQSNLRAEGEASEENRPPKVVFEPTQCRANVALFAVPTVVLALAQAYATEVEAQHGQAKR